MSEAIPNLDPSLKGPLWRVAARNRVTRVARAARVVREPLAFVASELVRRDGKLRGWRPRGGASPVFLRAGSPDFEVFEEIFRARSYAVPEQARAALDGLGRPLVVGDVGANIGLFSAWIMGELDVGEIRLVEPDPTNLAVLRRFVEASGRVQDLRVVPAAAGTQEGVLELRSGGFQMSRAAAEPQLYDGEVVQVPVVDLFALLEGVDLLKLDIEGAEWPILTDERFARLPLRALVIEYHRSGSSPHGDLPEVIDTLLGSAGYRVRHLFWNPPWVGQLWAWRTS